MSKKLSNYNQTIENELDEYLGFAYRYHIDFINPECILNKLLEIYDKYKYPGIYYRIGYLYECGCFKKLNKDKSLDYYELAANEGYVDAMNHLAELGLRRFIDHEYKYVKWALKSAIEYDNAYGKYLLAKYYMIRGLLEDPMKEYRIKGFDYMRESANQECFEAIEFIKMYKRINYESKL